LRLTCPAKINLHLEVGERRPDGYHRLVSLYQGLDLADDLVVEAATSGPSLEVGGPRAGAAPPGASNLVLRAARALAVETGRDALPTRFHLTKRIPAGAGLGGGSSNAAAALTAMRSVHRLKLTDSQLARIAADLGSDISFFLLAGTAAGRGRGERIEPLADLPRLGVLLVCPREGLSTPRVYETLDRLRSHRKSLTPPEALPNIEEIIRQLSSGKRVVLRNDLFVAARELMPRLGDWCSRLEALDPIAVSMTGSGSALYALFPDLTRARSAGGRFQAAGTEVFATAFRPREDPPGA